MEADCLTPHHMMAVVHNFSFCPPKDGERRRHLAVTFQSDLSLLGYYDNKVSNSDHTFTCHCTASSSFFFLASSRREIFEVRSANSVA